MEFVMGQVSFQVRRWCYTVLSGERTSKQWNESKWLAKITGSCELCQLWGSHTWFGRSQMTDTGQVNMVFESTLGEH